MSVNPLAGYLIYTRLWKQFLRLDTLTNCGIDPTIAHLKDGSNFRDQNQFLLCKGRNPMWALPEVEFKSIGEFRARKEVMENPVDG